MNTVPEHTNSESNPPDNKINSIQDLIKVPWLGLRSDLVIYPGPVESNGERTWVVEDPARGNTFRLGYAEGELFFRLLTEPGLDAAVAKLYTTTTLRPTPSEIAAFIMMLQKESLANLPSGVVVQREAHATKNGEHPSLLRKLMEGATIFRISLIRPDRFLTRTFPYLSWLWHPILRMVYLIVGFIGLLFMLQEVELYFSTVSYLFTPQGAMAFLASLIAIKIGHEFAHAYTAKAMGLHVRSMGIFFIILLPRLYTDTTDVWKIPDRRRRSLVSLAGVMFELVLGGIALFLWAILSDGVLRSLMFFLSGTSLASTILINLNPFMRYDGYYLLMDRWGIDNLRPRASALFRHVIRRLVLDWKGPIPEYHPNHRALVVYGFLVVLYRLLICFSIALAVYYLYHPIIGIALMFLEFWLFIFYPLSIEITAVYRERHFIGSKMHLCVVGILLLACFALLIVPFPKLERLPAIVVFKGSNRIETTGPGKIAMSLPPEGMQVKAGELLMRIIDEGVEYETRKVMSELSQIKIKIQSLGSGGQQGAYRNWLKAEEERLTSSMEKLKEAIAQLEIRASMDGKIADVNEDLYKDAYVAKGTYLFTLTNPEGREVKAFVHEHLMNKLNTFGIERASVRFSGLNMPVLIASYREKSAFPVRNLPNLSLYDIAGGPITSVKDAYGTRPRDAYFTFHFDIRDIPEWIPHGTPSWIWIKSEHRSVMARLIAIIWQSLIEREFF